jgi:hypothetical protein
MSARHAAFFERCRVFAAFSRDARAFMERNDAKAIHLPLLKFSKERRRLTP